MDEIIPGLWVGDLASALDTEKLREKGIGSVVSAMRGRVSIHPTFIRHQINLDDEEDADVLSHLVPAVSFIQAELDKGRGVLIHCQAGMSRSATIAAAYLMYARNMDPASALEHIRKVRPQTMPNEGFLRQLDVFYKASFKVSRHDKNVRMFYLERAVAEMMNGYGEIETDMFAKYPPTPSDSVPPTPGGLHRRIRCKLCRTELARREHMMDHGQLGPATPAVSMGLSPATSRRPSMDPQQSNLPRRGSNTASERRPSGLAVPRRPSGLANDVSRAFRAGFGMTAATAPSSESTNDVAGAEGMTRSLSDSLSMTSLSMSSTEKDDAPAPPIPLSRRGSSSAGRPALPFIEENKPLPPASTDAKEPAASGEGTGQRPPPLSHGSDLAAQLFANPKLAALRSGMGMTPVSGQGSSKPAAPVPAPILINPKCSGYFLEPMKWMEPFLEQGQLAGKIVCPNKKCGAKLGNYDWAGVCCSCKEWVTPGFCIHRSKVDEVV
ncbi:hypothetical protein GLOTRDRAFT_80177 [Gloeophyllum trabeum ATCC 11539]|uniref:protein-tyrosine-phosphatase n=1 Tax=Gloeophyllum trabeum (strain ATCC 11539 / FP-39264 / Madison 617) TaxID=670483 RepID=S7PWP3_GLOTA|nr:uncharacterized protein GLOTRDRAFT_80177 [Gloeophyllum trabeum ATCC 11539]EPQ52031.1 hypothetical protein GLOTRDRAFT_80177 [Gloeophyllum trabeum ATCC 11539]